MLWFVNAVEPLSAFIISCYCYYLGYCYPLFMRMLLFAAVALLTPTGMIPLPVLVPEPAKVANEDDYGAGTPVPELCT